MNSLIKYLQLKYRVILVVGGDEILYDYDSKLFGIMYDVTTVSFTNLIKWVELDCSVVIINIIEKAKREALFHITLINEDNYDSPYDVNNNDEIIIYKGIISIDMDKLIEDTNDDACRFLYNAFKEKVESIKHPK